MSTKRSAATGLARSTSAPDDDFSVSAEPDMKRPRTTPVQRVALRQTLTQHESKHTVDDHDKPYACDQCNYRSKAVANLRVPLPLPTAHKSGLPFVCFFCMFRFFLHIPSFIFTHKLVAEHLCSDSRTRLYICSKVFVFLLSFEPFIIIIFCVFPGPCAHTSYRRAPVRM